MTRVDVHREFNNPRQSQLDGASSSLYEINIMEPSLEFNPSRIQREDIHFEANRID